MDAAKKLTLPFGRIYRHFMQDSLRRNSILLILSQAINAAAMFLFWVICARIFKTKDVGLATAFISLTTLVATFTQLGAGNTTVRFLPTIKNKSGFFNAALLITIFGSFIGSAFVIIFIHSLSHQLGFIRHSGVLMIELTGLILVSSVTYVTDGALLSFRRAEYLSYKAIAANLPKLILPFIVIILATKGILLAYVVGLGTGVIYELVILRGKFFHKQTLLPNFTSIWDKRHFAVGNYLGSIASILPTTLLSLIVLNHLGAKDAAYFYMPMQISGFLIVIASSTSQVMLSEASQDKGENNKLILLKEAFLHAYRMLIPASVIFIAAGWVALRFYGKAYQVNGFWLLVLLCIASLFVAINTLGDMWLLVKKNMKGYTSMQVLNAVVVIMFVYLFLRFGLIGVGVGWLLGQLLTAVVYILLYERERLYSLVRPRK
jgi:O-antigen/teichoic acid export membrane protein